MSDTTLELANRIPSEWAKIQPRNERAWKAFSPDGERCPFCEHDYAAHLIAAGQPHFYRPVKSTEKKQSSVLYRHTLRNGEVVLVKKMVVQRAVEIRSAFCTKCAEAKQTNQAVCFIRNDGVGETIGFG